METQNSGKTGHRVPAMTDQDDPMPVPALPEGAGEFLFYQTEDGQTRLQVRLHDGTVWLTQRLLAELYQVAVPTINEHLQGIYGDGELDPTATIRKFLIVQTEGTRRVRRMVDHYSLPAILAVGYRVRSFRGTQFRQWATTRLNEYLVKGFVLDDERLKAGASLGADYFDELLERIRDIRASERRFYQKITDIYAQCSVDYDPKAEITQTFYATVQNKLHWAIHGHTAAELVYRRVDAGKPHLGLTTWKNAPAGRIRKSDVSVAKNFLTEEELRALNRIVTMYLDFAELQAERRREMTMADWITKLDDFLKFNEHNILEHAGKVTQKMAQNRAEAEFAKYEAERRRVEASQASSDFDRVVEETRQLAKQANTKAKEKKP
jgi:hypothetical protein